MRVPQSPLPELRDTFFIAERIDPTSRRAVQGVILDVPLEEGIDTLAAYADGTARYINHSGRTIIWEVADPDHPMRPLVEALLEAATTVPLPATRQPWRAPTPPDNTMLATVLTPIGPVTTVLGSDQDSGGLIQAGVALMTALIDAAPES